ncbi:hypothetical protein RRG08_038322 [Elysia crispata]|uniref:Uncharacterized protein n=1 Tax=Elysia crispata TaxID=231223 RepID=A0AAE1E1T6_9GAST|nr:hypothetical protein RRG08_038322 [Elysia crispata]
MNPKVYHSDVRRRRRSPIGIDWRVKERVMVIRAVRDRVSPFLELGRSSQFMISTGQRQRDSGLEQRAEWLKLTPGQSLGSRTVGQKTAPVWFHQVFCQIKTCDSPLPSLRDQRKPKPQPQPQPQPQLVGGDYKLA